MVRQRAGFSGPVRLLTCAHGRARRTIQGIRRSGPGTRPPARTAGPGPAGAGRRLLRDRGAWRGQVDPAERVLRPAARGAARGPVRGGRLQPANGHRGSLPPVPRDHGHAHGQRRGPGRRPGAAGETPAPAPGHRADTRRARPRPRGHLRAGRGDHHARGRAGRRQDPGTPPRRQRARAGLAGYRAAAPVRAVHERAAGAFPPATAGAAGGRPALGRRGLHPAVVPSLPPAGLGAGPAAGRLPRQRDRGRSRRRPPSSGAGAQRGQALFRRRPGGHPAVAGRGRAGLCRPFPGCRTQRFFPGVSRGPVPAHRRPCVVHRRAGAVPERTRGPAARRAGRVDRRRRLHLGRPAGQGGRGDPRTHCPPGTGGSGAAGGGQHPGRVIFGRSAGRADRAECA